MAHEDRAGDLQTVHRAARSDRQSCARVCRGLHPQAQNCARSRAYPARWLDIRQSPPPSSVGARSMDVSGKPWQKITTGPSPSSMKWSEDAVCLWCSSLFARSLTITKAALGLEARKGWRRRDVGLALKRQPMAGHCSSSPRRDPAQVLTHSLSHAAASDVADRVPFAVDEQHGLMHAAAIGRRQGVGDVGSVIQIPGVAGAKPRDASKGITKASKSPGRPKRGIRSATSAARDVPNQTSRLRM